MGIKFYSVDKMHQFFLHGMERYSRVVNEEVSYFIALSTLDSWRIFLALWFFWFHLTASVQWSVTWELHLCFQYKNLNKSSKFPFRKTNNKLCSLCISKTTSVHVLRSLTTQSDGSSDINFGHMNRCKCYQCFII